MWQVIECAFQQDRGQGASLDNMSKNAVVGKGQVNAVSALKELRKISNLLSEMWAKSYIDVSCIYFVITIL